MSRFTFKLEKPFPIADDCVSYYGMPNHYEIHTATNAANKLGKLEDIEEELGISLNVLFEALKNGVFIFDQESNDIIKFKNVILNYNGFSWILYIVDHFSFVKVKNYKKTWGLTKEELKNELP